MQEKKEVLILGGGFAGLNAAMSAARYRDDFNAVNRINIKLISNFNFFTPKPRLYESNLTFTQPIEPILKKIGVDFICSEIKNIDINNKFIYTNEKNYNYNSLIVALGSKLKVPNIDGFDEFCFNIDTFQSASKMQEHLAHQSLGNILVIGAGFTGIELATELASLRKDQIILIDSSNKIGKNLGEYSTSIIQNAISSLNIKTYINTRVLKIRKNYVYLSNDLKLDCHTVIWTGGVESNHLSASLSEKRDEFQRVLVNKYLQLPDHNSVFIAGDMCKANTNLEGNPQFATMSCQHGIIQGLFAGFNSIALLEKNELLVYQHKPYITCLDLGKYGALLTKMWDRKLFYNESYDLIAIKKIKKNINSSLSIPDFTKEDILRDAMPIELTTDYSDYLKICQNL